MDYRHDMLRWGYQLTGLTHAMIVAFKPCKLGVPNHRIALFFPLWEIMSSHRHCLQHFLIELRAALDRISPMLLTRETPCSVYRFGWPAGVTTL